MASVKHAAVILGALLCTSLTHAQDAKPQGGVSRELERQFKALDRNGDGYLSRDELMADKSLSGGFNNADKDRDGKLDMSEFQALEADRSPDRSYGSVAPQEKDQASGTGASAAPPQRSE